MLKQLLNFGMKSVTTAVKTGADLQYKKLETKYRLINLGLVLGVTALRLTSKVAIAGTKAVYRGTKAVGSVLSSSPKQGSNKRNRRNSFDFGHDSTHEDRPKKKPNQTLNGGEWREDVDPATAYDFHSPSYKENEKPRQQEKMDEREKLSEIDPKKAEVLAKLQEEGIIGKPKESLLEGIYDGDKWFKQAFQSMMFPKGVTSVWDELSYTLKVTFPAGTPVTLLAKEEGIYYPNHDPLFIFGQGGKEGDMTVALTRFLQSVPQEHAEVFVGLMHEYKRLMVGTKQEETGAETLV